MEDCARDGTRPCHMPGGHERNEHRRAWLPLPEFMIRGVGVDKWVSGSQCAEYSSRGSDVALSPAAEALHGELHAGTVWSCSVGHIPTARLERYNDLGGCGGDVQTKVGNFSKSE